MSTIDITPVTRRSWSGVSFGDSLQMDAQGRLRVSPPRVVFEFSGEWDSGPHLWAERMLGAGGVLHSSGDIAITSVTGGVVIRQTRQYFKHTFGVSRQILLGGVFGRIFPGVTQRLGYFDNHGGLFWGYSALGLHVGVRMGTDTVIPQSQWNIDRMDGKGPSNIVVNPERALIFGIDLEGAGIGRYRFFLSLDGVKYPVHEVYASGVHESPIQATGSLPLRYEVSGASTLRQLGSVVLDEGDTREISQPFAIDGSGVGTPSLITLSPTRRPVLVIRSRMIFGGRINRVQVALRSLSTFLTGNGFARYELVYGGTLGGSTLFLPVHTESSVEYNSAATTLTGGVVVDGGSMAIGNNRFTLLEDLHRRYPMGLGVDGQVGATWSLCLSRVGGTASAAFPSFMWSEFQ